MQWDRLKRSEVRVELASLIWANIPKYNLKWGVLRCLLHEGQRVLLHIPATKRAENLADILTTMLFWSSSEQSTTAPQRRGGHWRALPGNKMTWVHGMQQPQEPGINAQWYGMVTCYEVPFVDRSQTGWWVWGQLTDSYCRGCDHTAHIYETATPGRFGRLMLD